MNKNYKVIESIADFEDSLDHLNAHEYITYDTETNGLNVRKDTVIGFAFSGAEGVGYYLPIYVWKNDELVEHSKETKERSSRLLAILKTKKLIMHNASYDCRITKSSLNVDLIDSLYCDTILLKHAVDEERPFGLKDIAKKIQGQIGLDITTAANAEQIDMIESIKANGGTVTKDKYELYKADMMKIGIYACSDVDLTLRVFNYYSKLLTSEGLDKFFYVDETMPLLKYVTIPMEAGGIPIDVSGLQSAQEEIIKDINKLESDIQSAIEPLLPPFKRWFLWLKFPPRRSGAFAQALASHVGLALPKTDSGRHSLSVSNLEQLPSSPYRDFLLGGDYLSDEIVEAVQLKLFAETGEKYMFNISSKHHLKKLFFEILEETPISKTDKGNPQVDHLFLASIKNKHDWMPLMLDYNKLNKIKGTYIDRILERQEDGVYYPQWHMHRTTSGRLGGDLMQLPRQVHDDSISEVVKKYNNKIRNFIIAGEGCKLSGADWASLEVVVFADDSNETSLLRMIRNNEDFYSKTAINVYGLQDKYSADKKAANFLKNHEPELRQEAKVYSLGIRYNMQSFKLSKTLDISERKAKSIIKKYFEAAPKLKVRMDGLVSYAKEKGYVKSKAGRIRHLPLLKKLQYAHGEVLGDSLALWKKYHEQPKKYANMKYLSKQYRSMINNCLNFPIQSMAATICNRASIAISRELKRLGLDAGICMIIHDEIVVRCKTGDAERVAKLLQYIMENQTKLQVPLTADPATGDRYGEIK